MFWSAWIRKHGQAFAALALLAMIVRAIVPAGYMLAPARQGELLAITLCSSHGPVKALIDLKTGALVEHQKKTPEKSGASDAPCVFAAVPALAARHHQLGLTQGRLALEQRQVPQPVQGRHIDGPQSAGQTGDFDSHLGASQRQDRGGCPGRSKSPGQTYDTEGSLPGDERSGRITDE